MNSEQFKAFREAQKLTQTELANALGISRESVTKYERAVNPVPKAVSMACGLLSLGVQEFDGTPITLERFRVMSAYGVEWLESSREGWRSKPQKAGEIAEWMERQGYKLADDNSLSTNNVHVAMDITVRWR